MRLIISPRMRAIPFSATSSSYRVITIIGAAFMGLALKASRSVNKQYLPSWNCAIRFMYDEPSEFFMSGDKNIGQATMFDLNISYSAFAMVPTITSALSLNCSSHSWRILTGDSCRSSGTRATSFNCFGTG